MALQTDDQFILKRDTSYFTVKFDTLHDEIRPGKAVQSDANDAGGTLGLMYPGQTLRYDGATGKLDVDFPATLRFIDVITEPYPEPYPYEYYNGDFYLVSCDETTTIPIDPTKWLNIDGTSYLQLEVDNPGTVYLANAGLFENFGGDGSGSIYTNVGDLADGESHIASGLKFNASIVYGRIQYQSIVITDGGSLYKIGDRFEISSVHGGAPAEFIVEEVEDGKVTRFLIYQDEETRTNSPIEYGDNFTGTDPDYVGYGFLLPKAQNGDLRRVPVFNRTGIGTGMEVDCNVQNGQILSAVTSPFSSHNNYKTGDRLIVGQADGSAGDSNIIVKLDTDSVDEIYANNGDKIVYRASNPEQNAEAAWIHIESGKSDLSVLGLAPLYKGIATEPNGKVYHQPEIGISTQVDTVTRIAEFTIANAYYELNQSATGIDNYASFSGLYSPQEKFKLDSVTPGATPGELNELITGSYTDRYTGNQYKNVDIVEVSNIVGIGTTLSIDVRSADFGMRGLTQLIKEEELISNISAAGSDDSHNSHRAIPEEAVVGGELLTSHFMPKNLSVLRKLY